MLVISLKENALGEIEVTISGKPCCPTHWEPFRNAVASLKKDIPAGLRRFDPDRKVWTIDPSARDMLNRWLGGLGSFTCEVVVKNEQDAVPRHVLLAFRELHLLPTAPGELVAAAYRCLAKLYHPDFGGSTERMQRINAAYDLLQKTLRKAEDERQ